MNENKINIAELLKDCPKGMELDCTMYDDVSLINVLIGNTYPIKIETPDGQVSLNKYGCYSNNKHAKCVIFPKGKTTWEGIKAPFKDGDIVSTDDGIYTAIVRRVAECETEDLYDHNEGYETYCHISSFEEYEQVYFGINVTPLRFCRLANEEEKERLFQAIKAKGYKWNAETKTLEKLSTSKFDITTLKPFDKVLVRDNDGQLWQADLFGFHGNTIYPFNCVGHYTNQCIPYDGNEHLLGTTDNCDEFYKTWE